VRAVAWHGTEDMRVDEVADATIEELTNAIVRITSTAICGSDLHLQSRLESAVIRVVPSTRSRLSGDVHSVRGATAPDIRFMTTASIDDEAGR